MSVYLRSQKNSAGRVARCGKYWISFPDHQGIRRRMPALTDRRQSEALERQIKSLAAARVGGDSATPEQERFIAGLPKAMVKKLVRWDILPGAKLEAGRPLAEHVAEYIVALRAKGRNRVYCDNTRRFLDRMVNECGWKKLTDLTPESIINWRDSLQPIIQNRKSDGSDGVPPDSRNADSAAASARTKNEYLSAAQTFGNWLVKQGRMTRNPLANIGRVEQRGREVYIRRAMTDDEIIRLLDAASVYRIVYLTALTTGLRRGELAKLRWTDIHLEAARPFINVRAGISKNHKMATMFLRQDVADGLRAIARTDTSRVFNMPDGKRFKSHLQAAGIPAKDKAGRVVDFHALRHTFITSLSKAGVKPRDVMELARHSQIDLTMRVYTDAGMLGTAEAVNSLPAWTMKPSKDIPQQVMATGTDPLPLSDMVEPALKKRDAKRDAEGGKGRILPDLAGQPDISGHPAQDRENLVFTRVFHIAGERSRTSTCVNRLEPESSASANSATPADGRIY